MSVCVYVCACERVCVSPMRVSLRGAEGAISSECDVLGFAVLDERRLRQIRMQLHLEASQSTAGDECTVCECVPLFLVPITTCRKLSKILVVPECIATESHLR